MKRLQIICLITIIMSFAVSCKETPKEKEGQQDQEVVPEMVTSPVTPSVDSMASYTDSTSWTGAYSGVSPCADCPGIKTDITLNHDKTYVLQEQYLEKEKNPRSFKGSFTIDETKKVITLDAEGDHHKFKVMDGKLRLLDKFGDEKQGGKPEDFVLAKIK
ncbi:copper resistance protein NlpE [Flavobacterium sp. DG1-102-2]|uniref:copper resistance protein NlpE n=1 Tax=Flavobacterium sp. DG1-102-2 TaxID=3081663 RepID=UPI00294A85C0|nr:copper resistance protein NlpE [Flavobacterium sp. DG1-102-2]MDV6169532.1 copper resistance protein NlpE [Flavobacterium sp. DG1-102-2]